MSDNARQREPRKRVLIRRSHPVRDNVEGILGALLLALIVRHFVFEMFVIPTGSMAPTLLGQHRDLTCPNCGYKFALDSGYGTDGKIEVHRAVCRNCGFEISERTVRSTFCRCFPSWPKRIFWRGGNRVIVNKFMAHYRRPERWDVIVFRYPIVEVECKSCGYKDELSESAAERADRCPACGSRRIVKSRKNFIKRLIALPGETVALRHGDVYIDGAIARKPPEAQEQLWQFIYDSGHRIQQPQESDYAPQWEAMKGDLKREGSAFKLSPDPDGEASIRFVPPITDRNPYNGETAAVSEGMGDLRVTLKAKLPEGGAVGIHIREDDAVYTGVVRFGDAGPPTAIRSGVSALAENEFRLDPSVEHVIAFANADDRLELSADGKTVLSWALEIPLREVPESTWKGSVAISAYDGPGDFGRVKLERDIFYVSAGVGTTLPENGFYVLGDNSTKSKDSRSWGFVPRENILGTADVVCWPLSHLRALRKEACADSD